MPHPLEVGQRTGRSEQVSALDGGRALLAPPDEGVATQGDDDAAHARRSPLTSAVRTE